MGEIIAVVVVVVVVVIVVVVVMTCPTKSNNINQSSPLPAAVLSLAL